MAQKITVHTHNVDDDDVAKGLSESMTDILERDGWEQPARMFFVYLADTSKPPFPSSTPPSSTGFRLSEMPLIRLRYEAGESVTDTLNGFAQVLHQGGIAAMRARLPEDFWGWMITHEAWSLKVGPGTDLSENAARDAARVHGIHNLPGRVEVRIIALATPSQICLYSRARGDTEGRFARAGSGNLSGDIPEAMEAIARATWG